METYQRTFLGLPEEIRRARHWLRTVLHDCPSLDTAALIVTELGTNALLHTASGHQGGSFRVTLTQTGQAVSISVTDNGTTTNTPRIEHPVEDDPHGRGLCLVAALADCIEGRGDEHGRTVTVHLSYATR
jgi:anti-sigma regulatory factor (Ser/Thr protein kinase)